MSDNEIDFIKKSNLVKVWVTLGCTIGGVFTMLYTVFTLGGYYVDLKESMYKWDNYGVQISANEHIHDSVHKALWAYIYLQDKTRVTQSELNAIRAYKNDTIKIKHEDN